MGDFLAEVYPWTKACHVMAVIAWMAGLFYLPRLFVYHVEGLKKQGVEQGSDMDLLFQHQERLLLKAIMNPSMIVTWLLGLAAGGYAGHCGLEHGLAMDKGRFGDWDDVVSYVAGDPPQGFRGGQEYIDRPAVIG